MPEQLTIEFAPLHKSENNFDSQSFLDEHRGKFTLNCWKVLIRLLCGERLTVAGTAQLGEGHISSLPRRVKDLKDRWQVPVQDAWIKDDDGKRLYKVYFIAEEDRLFIADKILNKTGVITKN